jgi:hypothetical protein
VGVVPGDAAGLHTHHCCRSMVVHDHPGNRNLCFLVDVGYSLHRSGLDQLGPKAAVGVPTYLRSDEVSAKESEVSKWRSEISVRSADCVGTCTI